jgi:hypothetical protein
MHKVVLPLIFAGLLIIRPALSEGTSDSKAVAIGPWQIEASFTDQRKFDRCVMRRDVGLTS